MSLNPSMPRRMPAQHRIKKKWQHLAEKQVIICVPTRGNDIYWKLVAFLIQQYHTWPELRVLFCRSSWQSPTLSALSYLEDKEYDYVFFVDADVGPGWDTILQLMSHDKDMVTAPVYMFEPNAVDIHLNVHHDDDLRPIYHRGKGLEQIYSSSFASLLIKKEVLQEFKKAGESYTGWSSAVPLKLKKMPIDVRFFAKCNHFGFKLYVDWECKQSVHHKYIEMSEDSLDMFFIRKGQDIKEVAAHGTTAGSF